MSPHISSSHQFINSNEVAADRLRMIVRSDREAVPCGRWVYKGQCFRKFKAGEFISLGDFRAHYRWEVRR